MIIRIEGCVCTECVQIIELCDYLGQNKLTKKVLKEQLKVKLCYHSWITLATDSATVVGRVNNLIYLPTKLQRILFSFFGQKSRITRSELKLKVLMQEESLNHQMAGTILRRTLLRYNVKRVWPSSLLNFFLKIPSANLSVNKYIGAILNI